MNKRASGRLSSASTVRPKRAGSPGKLPPVPERPPRLRGERRYDGVNNDDEDFDIESLKRLTLHWDGDWE